MSYYKFIRKVNGESVFKIYLQPFSYQFSGYGNMMDIDFTSDEINVTPNVSLETRFEENTEIDPEPNVTNLVSGRKRTSEVLVAERYFYCEFMETVFRCTNYT